MTTAILTSARARDSLQSQNQKRAAFGVGCEGDTSPLGGLLRSTARIPCGNQLKRETMKGGEKGTAWEPVGDRFYKSILRNGESS